MIILMFVVNANKSVDMAQDVVAICLGITDNSQIVLHDLAHVFKRTGKLSPKYPDLYKLRLIKGATKPFIFDKLVGNWIQWNKSWKFWNKVSFTSPASWSNLPVIPRSDASFEYNEASSWPIWTSFLVFHRVGFENLQELQFRWFKRNLSRKKSIVTIV